MLLRMTSTDVTILPGVIRARTRFSQGVVIGRLCDLSFRFSGDSTGQVGGAALDVD